MCTKIYAARPCGFGFNFDATRRWHPPLEVSVAHGVLELGRTASRDLGTENSRPGENSPQWELRILDSGLKGGCFARQAGSFGAPRLGADCTGRGQTVSSGTRGGSRQEASQAAFRVHPLSKASTAAFCPFSYSLQPKAAIAAFESFSANSIFK